MSIVISESIYNQAIDYLTHLDRTIQQEISERTSQDNQGNKISLDLEQNYEEKLTQDESQALSALLLCHLAYCPNLTIDYLNRIKVHYSNGANIDHIHCAIQSFRAIADVGAAQLYTASQRGNEDGDNAVVRAGDNLVRSGICWQYVIDRAFHGGLISRGDLYFWDSIELMGGMQKAQRILMDNAPATAEVLPGVFADITPGMVIGFYRVPIYFPEQTEICHVAISTGGGSCIGARNANTVGISNQTIVDASYAISSKWDPDNESIQVRVSDPANMSTRR